NCPSPQSGPMRPGATGASAATIPESGRGRVTGGGNWVTSVWSGKRRGSRGRRDGTPTSGGASRYGIWTARGVSEIGGSTMTCVCRCGTTGGRPSTLLTRTSITWTAMLRASAIQVHSRVRVRCAGLRGACECSTAHLLQDSAEPVDRLRESGGAHCHRDAEIAFAAGSERAPRQHDDTCFLEGAPSEQCRGNAGRKCNPEVHSGHRCLDHETYLAQRSDGGVTPVFQLCPNGLHQRLGLVQRRRPGL